MTRPFTLDKAGSKWTGVCAGFALWSEIDVTLVRVGLVLLTLAFGPLTLIGYLATAWIAPDA